MSSVLRSRTDDPTSTRVEVKPVSPRFAGRTEIARSGRGRAAAVDERLCGGRVPAAGRPPWQAGPVSSAVVTRTPPSRPPSARPPSAPPRPPRASGPRVARRSTPPCAPPPGSCEQRAETLLAANPPTSRPPRRSGMAPGPARPPPPHPRAPRRHGHPARRPRRHPEPPLQVFVRDLPTGERVYERRVPVGVIGAVFEARPNVTVDVASQVLAGFVEIGLDTIVDGVPISVMPYLRPMAELVPGSGAVRTRTGHGGGASACRERSADLDRVGWSWSSAGHQLPLVGGAGRSNANAKCCRDLHVDRRLGSGRCAPSASVTRRRAELQVSMPGSPTTSRRPSICAPARRWVLIRTRWLWSINTVGCAASRGYELSIRRCCRLPRRVAASDSGVDR